MLVLEGIFDGRQIKALQEIPIKTKKKVIITFLEDDTVDDVGATLDIDPITALRGCAKNSGLTGKLLQSRADDLAKEDLKWPK